MWWEDWGKRRAGQAAAMGRKAVTNAAQQYSAAEHHSSATSIPALPATAQACLHELKVAVGGGFLFQELQQQSEVFQLLLRSPLQHLHAPDLGVHRHRR